MSVLFLVVGMVMATTTRERGLEGTDAKSVGRTGSGGRIDSSWSIRGFVRFRGVRVEKRARSLGFVDLVPSGIVRKRRFPDSFITSPLPRSGEQVGSLGVSTPSSAWPTGIW